VRPILFSEPAKLLWMIIMMVIIIIIIIILIIIIIIIRNVKLNSKNLRKMRVWKYSFKYSQFQDRIRVTGHIHIPGTIAG